MLIAGLDPGLDGGIAFINPATMLVDARPMPTVTVSSGREVDAHQLAALFYQFHVGHAFVEKAWPRPSEGRSSAFKSGLGCGIIRGVLATVGVPYTYVAPVTWKKAIGAPAAKDGAIARASELMPQAVHLWPRKRDDGLAEAALIAMYGVRSLNSIASAA